jgi:hypothetical protein
LLLQKEFLSSESNRKSTQLSSAPLFCAPSFSFQRDFGTASAARYIQEALMTIFLLLMFIDSRIFLCSGTKKTVTRLPHSAISVSPLAKKTLSSGAHKSPWQPHYSNNAQGRATDLFVVESR